MWYNFIVKVNERIKRGHNNDLNLLATTSIEFPNLHISLNNLPKSFSLFAVV